MVCTQNKNPKDPKAKEQADCSLYLKESEDDPNPRKVPFNPCFEVGERQKLPENLTVTRNFASEN